MCALYQWSRINSFNSNFVKNSLPTSQKRSYLNNCDLNANVHDVEIPVCMSYKVLDIIMNEVLDWTELIKDVAKRLNYSLFVLKIFLKKCLPL